MVTLISLGVDSDIDGHLNHGWLIVASNLGFKFFSEERERRVDWGECRRTDKANSGHPVRKWHRFNALGSDCRVREVARANGLPYFNEQIKIAVGSTSFNYPSKYLFEPGSTFSARDAFPT